MIEWALIISVVAGGFGTVFREETVFPDQKSCYEAMAKGVQIHNPGQLAQGERGQTTIVRCVPRKKA